MNNMWDDDESEEFRDIPEDTKVDQRGQPAYFPPVNSTPNRTLSPDPKPAHVVEVESDVAEYEDASDNEEDFTEVLNDANLRIEQGRLYQMIMNHDLFQGMESDERAVQNVQKEIRKFAKERMEIMLGMRQERMMKDYTEFNAKLSNVFNELEVEILKKLASKATNGATETAEANQVAKALREPRKQALNPIGATSNKVVPKAQSKLPSKAQAPLPRKKMDATIDMILAEEGVPRELIEENYQPIGKSLDRLTPEELSKRQKETAARLAKRATVKSTESIPMATPEQQEMLAIQRATQVGQNKVMATLIAKAKEMPIKQN